MSHNVDTVHDISGDRETTLSDGSRLTLERSGIAWTVTTQEPGQQRWRAPSWTFWPEGGGPAVLPENATHVEDPAESARLYYETIAWSDRLVSALLASGASEVVAA